MTTTYKKLLLTPITDTSSFTSYISIINDETSLSRSLDTFGNNIESVKDKNRNNESLTRTEVYQKLLLTPITETSNFISYKSMLNNDATLMPNLDDFNEIKSINNKDSLNEKLTNSAEITEKSTLDISIISIDSLSNFSNITKFCTTEKIFRFQDLVLESKLSHSTTPTSKTMTPNYKPKKSRFQDLVLESKLSHSTPTTPTSKTMTPNYIPPPLSISSASNTDSPRKVVFKSDLVECFAVPNRDSPNQSIIPLAVDSPHRMNEILNSSPSISSIRRASNPLEDFIVKRINTEKNRLIEDIATLKKGDHFTLHSMSRSPRKYWLSLSQDESEISWSQEVKSLKFESVSILEAEILTLGCSSSAFANNKVKRPWNCLTIKFKEGTLDLECSESAQLIRWFMGIQSICPLKQEILTRSKLIWKRVALKVERICKNKNVSLNEICKQLIDSAKRAKC